jgi:uncharacterized protein (DUF305 family)
MHVRPLIAALSISVSALAFSPAWAEAANMKSAGAHMQHHKPSIRGATASTRAYEVAMATMHQHMNAPLSGNADVDFVRQMIPHHQGAVDMAKVQLQYGHDERLKSFNRWVIRAQELEIGMMKNWLARRDNGAVVANAKDYYGASMAAMHHGMMVDYTGDADVDFVRGMIPHHQGAVDMAAILLHDGNDPEMNDLANNIYSSQTYEISWMENWLAEHAAK